LNGIANAQQELATVGRSEGGFWGGELASVATAAKCQQQFDCYCQ